MRRIIYGPPGTGKTHTLLGHIEKFLETTDPDKIGYFTFSKNAAVEGKERAALKFRLSMLDDLPYFQTLHSFCFNQLSLSKDQVMKEKHYKELGEKMGLEIEGTQQDEDHDSVFYSKNPYIQLINIARSKEIDPVKYYHLTDNPQISLNKLKIISEELQRYKSEHGLVDFPDMIEKFLSGGDTPKLRVMFVDEAQDLSLIQWKLVRRIEESSTDSFIAGDDDQAIFRWAGADVDSFIAQEGQMLPLQQSYRIPARVHGLAMGIINKIKTRINKTWQPKIHKGSLSRYYDFEEINMSSGEWLVLARTKYMLDNLEEDLYLKGYYYQNKFRKQREHALHLAAIDWEHLRQGQLLKYDQLEKISSYTNLWDKQKMKGMVKDSFYGMDQLKKDYGLQTNDVWYTAFNAAPSRDINYLRKMRKNGEKLNEAPRITLSTIHGAKGGEAENVVLLTDLSFNTMKSYEKNPDDENRLFYVGATRTKEHLHIIRPQQDNKGYDL